jgi:hypothetical protein
MRKILILLLFCSCSYKEISHSNFRQAKEKKKIGVIESDKKHLEIYALVILAIWATYISE